MSDPDRSRRAPCLGGWLRVRDFVQARDTKVTGEAWYTEAIGFFGITWGSKVWYCPAPRRPVRRPARKPRWSS